MTLVRTAVAAAALGAVIATAGCGVGPGESSKGTAALTVTRDYGSEAIVVATATDPAASETVLRLLDREAEITTRFGGGFVHSINGIEGSGEGGRVRDWFFFVNGIESSTGSAEVGVRAGDRIWWDYRDWTDAMRAPAVVGSWPEPFAQVSAGSDSKPVAVVCLDLHVICDQAQEKLEQAGAETISAAVNQAADGPRLLVGTWDRVRRDRAAAQIEAGPATSGVFARFDRSGSGWTLVALDQTASPSLNLDEGGLVAAVREGDDPPTWVATGTDASAVREAVQILRESALRDHYAVVVGGTNPVPVPVG